MSEVVEISTIRQELHTLLDYIPDSDVATARKILRSLVDPVALALLNAPPDDEPLSESEKAALKEAEQRERRGDPLIPHDDILREFDPSKHSP